MQYFKAAINAVDLQHCIDFEEDGHTSAYLPCESVGHRSVAVCIENCGNLPEGS